MKYKVLVVGCGNMGAAHARAYHKLDDFVIIGIVSNGGQKRDTLLKEIGNYPTYNDFNEALAITAPDVVSINTYPDTHAEYAIKSINAGAHVFLEKPIAMDVESAIALVKLAHEKKRKLVIGYILRVHPAWNKLIEVAKSLGKPLVMRMNLNQQSDGENWGTHKNLLLSMSPLVDCGVHYVDVMCQMTPAKPISVNAIGARLTEEIAEDNYNYGQLQVRFDDGSIGWYESGWGPMISETAYFVKDIIGPKGAVSIVSGKSDLSSQDIDGHTQTGSLKIHHSVLNEKGEFAKDDEFIDTSKEPDHDQLCLLEQQYLLKAMNEDLDLSQHHEDAVQSLSIVLAADESVKSGATVFL